MASNGKQSPPRPRIEVQHTSASPEEAAAIAAAMEQFLRDTAPAPEAVEPGISRWLEAGLMEGVGREPGDGALWGKLL
jgi:hypothetical protein